MVEVKFFRDEKNVYFNNPNGVTTKKSIEDFEDWMSGEGGGGGDISDLEEDLRQEQTAFIDCESGTYADADGTVKLSTNVRIRNVRPVCVKGYDAIVIPDGYEAWIFRLDANGTHISAVGSWKSGKVMFSNILTDATRYINFAIKNSAKASSDISSEIGTVENGLILISTTATLKEDLYQLRNASTTVLEDAQNFYIQFNLIAGKTYNITDKGESGQFLMSTRNTKTGPNLESVGTFRAGETKQFVPTVNAEWLAGYANSATTIYIEEDGLVIPELESRIDNIEKDVDDLAVRIVPLNKPQEQIVYNLQKGRSTRFNDPFSPLTFIHFSDIHRAETLWERICEYMDKYNSVIPFALHTGDYVKAYIEQYTDLYAVQSPKNGYILNCVGNHDTYVNSTGTETATAETVYNLLFNHTSGWDVTFGTGSNIMYYYKDFSASGIRLIVLDQYYWDSTEEAWLQNLLDDARTNNLAVITASHTNTAPLIAENRVDCTFTSYDTLADGSQTITYVANLDTMIKAFKDAGGEHICHLSGHWHYDIIGYTANGTLCIAIECATSDHAGWCDSERIEGTKGYDCFNVISADRSLHQIRIARIGNSVDFHGREKNILCYDYLNKTVIANS